MQGISIKMAMCSEVICSAGARCHVLFQVYLFENITVLNKRLSCMFLTTYYESFISHRNKKVPEIECVLTLRKIRPIGGSLFGGTKLTLTGEGFSKDVYNIEVSVGGTDCEVHSATTTEVICTLSWNGKLHHVNNQGTHPGQFIPLRLHFLSAVMITGTQKSTPLLVPDK